MKQLIVYRYGGQIYSVPVKRVIKTIAREECGVSYENDCVRRIRDELIFDVEDLIFKLNSYSDFPGFLLDISNKRSERVARKNWSELMDVDSLLTSDLSISGVAEYKFTVIKASAR